MTLEKEAGYQCIKKIILFFYEHAYEITKYRLKVNMMIKYWYVQYPWTSSIQLSSPFFGFSFIYVF